MLYGFWTYDFGVVISFEYGFMVCIYFSVRHDCWALELRHLGLESNGGYGSMYVMFV